MSRLSTDYKVGMFTFSGLIVLGVLILIYGEAPTWFWKTQWKVAVLVDVPQGIQVGTPAYLQGVQIGRVTQIKLQNEKQPNLGAAVVIDVEKYYEIPLDSHATVHPKFGFDKGDIQIIPPPQITGLCPRDGSAAIPGKMTNALASIVPEDMMPKLIQAVNAIAALSQEVSDSLGEGGDLRIALGNIRLASEDAKNLAATLSARAPEILDQADHSLKAIETQTNDVGRSTVSTLDDLTKILDEVHSVVAAINRGEGTIGRLVYDSKFYDALLDLLDRIKLTIDDYRQMATSIEEKGLKVR